MKNIINNEFIKGNEFIKKMDFKGFFSFLGDLQAKATDLLDVEFDIPSHWINFCQLTSPVYDERYLKFVLEGINDLSDDEKKFLDVLIENYKSRK